MSGLEMVLRQWIRSVKAYSDHYTKKHPNGEPVKNASIQKVKENIPGLTKWNSLLHRKKFFVQLKKDGGVRPVGDLTVVAFAPYWSETRPINDDMSGISLGI